MNYFKNETIDNLEKLWAIHESNEEYKCQLWLNYFKIYKDKYGKDWESYCVKDFYEVILANFGEKHHRKMPTNGFMVYCNGVRID